MSCSALVFGIVAPLAARQTARQDMAGVGAVVRGYSAQLPRGMAPDLERLEYLLERRIALSTTKENWVQAGRASLTLVLPCAAGALVMARLAKRQRPG